MFYGYIGDTRSLNDVITGLLQGRSGTLELFINRYFLSLKVEDGAITEFRSDIEFFNRKKVNSYNLLVLSCGNAVEPGGFFRLL